MDAQKHTECITIPHWRNCIPNGNRKLAPCEFVLIQRAYMDFDLCQDTSFVDSYSGNVCNPGNVMKAMTSHLDWLKNDHSSKTVNLVTLLSGRLLVRS